MTTTLTPNGPSPYTDPRRTYNDRVAGALSSRFVMSAVTLFSLLIALVCAGGLVGVALQSKFVPYVLERTCGREPVPIGAAVPADALDPAVINLWKQGAVTNLITNARIVTPHVALQEKAIRLVYYFLVQGDPAWVKMSDWYNATPESRPTERAATVTVEVEISTVLEQSPDVWQVDWIERVAERDGKSLDEFRMRALLTVYRRTPTRETTEAEMRENPLGLFVKTFSWGRLL
jgi:type IV secretory pathway TrbF-like protein